MNDMTESSGETAGAVVKGVNLSCSNPARNSANPPGAVGRAQQNINLETFSTASVFANRTVYLPAGRQKSRVD
ncbi:MAG: hypothetical protein WDN46_05940 [Methylocella sp.]